MADTKTKFPFKAEKETAPKAKPKAKAKSEPKRPVSTPTDHARDLSAARPPASTDVQAAVVKGEWPVPPNTKNPPNPKVDGTDVTKLDRGLDDFSIERLDGANAVLRLGNQERLVGQADLHHIAKKISKAIQSTY